MKIIRLAIRTLVRFKLYTIVNIVGLALSLACVMIISRYVYREITVNHFNKDLDRICLTTQHYPEETMPRLSFYFRTSDFTNNSKVEKIAPYTSFVSDNITFNEKNYDARIIAADTAFLQILDYPIIKGDKRNPLKEPQNAVITESYAKKIFGKDDPIGKTLKHSSGKIVTITAVTGDPGGKSSLQFDILLSYQLLQNWGRIFYCFVRVSPQTNIADLNKELLAKHDPSKDSVPYQLLPYSKSYYDKSTMLFDDTFLRGNYTNILILSVVGLLVLLVGVFNFVNIYTIMMLKRGREFGIKKVFGASSSNAIVQLIGENVIIIGIALFIAWVIIEISKGFIESQLSIPQISNLKFDTILSAAILFILPVITSVYPFLKYNYATPISSLRSVNIGGNSIIPRSLFLVAQYIITFSMIVIALFFIKQLNFMLQADMGYKTDDIIKVQFRKEINYATLTEEEWMKASASNSKMTEEIEQKLKASPLFVLWTYGSSPYEHSGYTIRVKTADGDYQQVMPYFMPAKTINMYNLALKEGRLWNDSTDSFGSYKFIINEAAQKLFGITDIKNTLLQPESRLWHSSKDDYKTNPAYEIVGVVKDFKVGHLSKATPPVVISCTGESSTAKLMATIVPGRKQEAIAFLKKLHNDIVGGEFEYTFVEDEIEAMYNEDKKIAYIYSIFALIAILISSMGLFSLSLFDIQQRYREIALRKVNGAQVSDILWLLLRKYYLLLGTSFLIATPLSFMAIHKYLENFAAKAPISWWIFAIAAIITASISLLTLIFHILKAANSNPSKTLKNE